MWRTLGSNALGNKGLPALDPWHWLWDIIIFARKNLSCAMQNCSKFRPKDGGNSGTKPSRTIPSNDAAKASDPIALITKSAAKGCNPSGQPGNRSTSAMERPIICLWYILIWWYLCTGLAWIWIAPGFLMEGRIKFSLDKWSATSREPTSATEPWRYWRTKPIRPRSENVKLWGVQTMKKHGQLQK